MDILIGYLHSGLSAIGPFVLLLGLLVFVHELGHFSVAKYFKVRVEVFSLGFGKKLLKFKRGDTVYCLSLIPLGGYVKMFGDETGADIPEDLKAVSFNHKPVSQRIAIVLAGPLMNLFFAFFLFFGIALHGEEMRAPVLGDVNETSEAYQAGFRSGDRVLAVNSQVILTYDDLIEEMSSQIGQPLRFEVQRAGSDLKAEFPATAKALPNPNILSSQEIIPEIEGLNVQSYAPMVGIKEGSVAQRWGLKTGDVIQKINDVPVKHYRDLENLFVVTPTPWKIEVERVIDAKARKAEYPIIEVTQAQVPSLESVGIESSQLYLYQVVPKSPAEKIGLKPGDRIVQVQDVAPKAWEELLQTVKGFSGEGALKLKVLRAGELIDFEVIPQITEHTNAMGQEERRYTIGIVPWIQMAMPETVFVKSRGLWSGFKKGWEKTWDVSYMTVMSFVRLVQAQISPKNIGGVISIGQVASESFQMGIPQFLQMMAIISINLFILNLLPVPVLDGGHLVFYTIEALKGAPLSMRKLEIAQQVGLVLLLSLMVFALFNDFTRILTTW